MYSKPCRGSSDALHARISRCAWLRLILRELAPQQGASRWTDIRPYDRGPQQVRMCLPGCQAAMIASSYVMNRPCTQHNNFYPKNALASGFYGVAASVAHHNGATADHHSWNTAVDEVNTCLRLQRSSSNRPLFGSSTNGLRCSRAKVESHRGLISLSLSLSLSFARDAPRAGQPRKARHWRTSSVQFTVTFCRSCLPSGGWPGARRSSPAQTPVHISGSPDESVQKMKLILSVAAVLVLSFSVARGQGR